MAKDYVAQERHFSWEAAATLRTLLIEAMAQSKQTLDRLESREPESEGARSFRAYEEAKYALLEDLFSDLDRFAAVVWKAPGFGCEMRVVEK